MGISLIPIGPELLASIILLRLLNRPEGQTRVGQAGFRVSRECIDQLFTFRQLLE